MGHGHDATHAARHGARALPRRARIARRGAPSCRLGPPRAAARGRALAAAPPAGRPFASAPKARWPWRATKPARDGALPSSAGASRRRRCHYPAPPVPGSPGAGAGVSGRLPHYMALNIAVAAVPPPARASCSRRLLPACSPPAPASRLAPRAASPASPSIKGRARLPSTKGRARLFVWAAARTLALRRHPPLEFRLATYTAPHAFLCPAVLHPVLFPSTSICPLARPPLASPCTSSILEAHPASSVLAPPSRPRPPPSPRPAPALCLPSRLDATLRHATARHPSPSRASAPTRVTPQAFRRVSPTPLARLRRPLVSSPRAPSTHVVPRLLARLLDGILDGLDAALLAPSRLSSPAAGR